LSALAPSAGFEAPATRGLRVASVQAAALFLFMAVSGFALIEPSPYEFGFCIVAALFLITGLKATRYLVVLAALLLLYNIGGFLSLIPFMDEELSVRFIAISFYLMFTAVLFAALMHENTAHRLAWLHAGYLFAAWLSAVIAIIGYFDIAGLGEVLTRAGRATGTFKDPNVLGPFLVLPIAHLAMRMLTGRIGLGRGFFLISPPVFALFLTFSRGAWGLLVITMIVMLALMFFTAGSGKARARVVAFSLSAFAVATVALLIALSFEQISELFAERASLTQSYDLGVQGRFGSQFRSIPLLLDAPNGLGPLRYRFYFPEDPHNVYINAFASYGWLGGFSYLALTALTMMVGFKMVFRRSAFQQDAIVIWSTLFVLMLQGFQIDTDHWRHFYLLLGLTWGLAAVVLRNGVHHSHQ
jgi:O-antigen ligase